MYTKIFAFIFISVLLSCSKKEVQISESETENPIATYDTTAVDSFSGGATINNIKMSVDTLSKKKDSAVVKNDKKSEKSPEQTKTNAEKAKLEAEKAKKTEKEIKSKPTEKVETPTNKSSSEIKDGVVNPQ